MGAEIDTPCLASLDWCSDDVTEALAFREVGKYELAPMELVTEIAEPSDMCEWAESYEWGGSDS